jgi:enamine deaminase RidA (YjgF/YER057c/UK114 family)
MNQVAILENESLAPPSLASLPVETRQLVGAIIGQVVLAIGAETRKSLEAIKLEMRAIVEDNSSLRSSISHLNEAMGKFREHEAMPLRDALQDFNTNAASRVAENQSKLEILIQALTRSMEASNIPIPDDVRQMIKDGRFEELKHMVASETPENREPGAPIL